MTARSEALTPPSLRDGDSWRAVCILAPFGVQDGSRAYIDHKGHLWITTHDASSVQLVTRDEAIGLTQFLVEHFQLRVLNEQTPWDRDVRVLPTGSAVPA